MNDKRKLIIECASNLIRVKGVQETTLANIAHALGISKGTLYYYYETKDKLIVDVTHHYTNQITLKIKEILEKTTEEEKLMELVERIISDLLKDERILLHLNLIHEAIHSNQLIKSEIRKAYNLWDKLLQQGIQEKCEANHQEFFLMSSTIIAILDGLSIQKIIKDEPVDVASVAKILIGT